MKSVFLSLIAASCVALAACGSGKPSYSDASANQGSVNLNNANQSSSIAPGDTSDKSLSPAQPPAAQTQAPPSQDQQSVVPDFFDQSKGQIKDLPIYPGARIFNIQYGPMNGVQTMLILLQSAEPFEKITKFYDAAIKSNGWTVAGSTNDPDTFTYARQLKKGETGEGLVQVKKNPQTELIEIMLNRIQKPAQPKK